MRHGGFEHERRGPRGPRRGGRGRLGMREQRTTAEQRQQIKAWFTGRLPDGWYAEVPQVTVDDEEILVVGKLPDLAPEAGVSEEDRKTAEAARITRFREDTRDERIRIAEEAQGAF